MTDQQIAPGQGPTPVGITVQGSEQLMPKLAFASYDGTGAAGDFLPVVRFVGPGGQVAGQAVGDKVAAGASADQTWFRGLSTAAAAAGKAWAYAQLGINKPVPGGLGDQSFLFLTTNDAVAFVLDGHAVQGVQFNKAGDYLIEQSWNVQNDPAAPVASAWTIPLQAGFASTPGSVHQVGQTVKWASGVQTSVNNATWNLTGLLVTSVSSAQVGQSLKWSWNFPGGATLETQSCAAFIQEL